MNIIQARGIDYKGGACGYKATYQVPDGVTIKRDTLLLADLNGDVKVVKSVTNSIEVGEDFLELLAEGEDNTCFLFMATNKPFKITDVKEVKPRIIGIYELKELNPEYDPPKLTSNEKAFLDGITSVFIYIARDSDDKLLLFTIEPYKINNGTWGSNGSSCILLNSDMFSFITWSDENPWTIEELKNLEVEDEESYDMSTYVR